MKRFLLAIAATVLPAVTVSAQGTITFEDAPCFCQVSPGYHDLGWDNFYFHAESDFSEPSGYKNARVSGSWMVFNAFGLPAAITQGASPFTLNSGYFTAAWNDGLDLAVTGFVGGIATYSADFTLDTSGPQFLLFNWTNLDRVEFVTSGGVDHGYDHGPGTLTHFALDNLTINGEVNAVPEPASMALLGTGLVGLFGFTRRRLHRGNTSE